MRRILTILILFVSSVFGQTGTYTVEYKAVLVGAASVVTLQLDNTTTSKGAELLKAALYCSVESEFTLERNGTAASSTALTAVPLNTGMATAKVSAYRSSNTGVGTVMARYVVPAGSTFLLDLTDVAILPMTSTSNVSIRTASLTGTCITVMKWREY